VDLAGHGFRLPTTQTRAAPRLSGAYSWLRPTIRHRGAMTVLASPAAHPDPVLVRLIDGLEHPAAGSWTAAGRHVTISFTASRRPGRIDSRPTRAIEARVAVGEHADDIALTVRLYGPGRPAIIATSGWPVAPLVLLRTASTKGLRRWQLSGNFAVGGLVLPLEATLGYDGLGRRGDDMYGRFVLAARSTTVRVPGGSGSRSRCSPPDPHHRSWGGAA
jgi:hypothetical protein